MLIVRVEFAGIACRAAASSNNGIKSKLERH